MPRLCSTDDIAERDRLAYWVDAVCGNFIHVDCEPRRNCPLRGEMACYTAPGLRIGVVNSTAQIITRSAHRIATDPTDVFDIGIQVHGNGDLRQEGRHVSLKPGDLALHDSSRPWQLAFDGGFSQIVLQVPRSALLRRLGGAEGLGALRIGGLTGVGAVLSQALRQLPSQFERIPTTSLARLGDNLLDLIATALLAEAGWAPPPSGDMTLARARLWIETHLTDELTAECIAQACHVSARHLNRLFARDETTLMRYVWRRRLARCHRDLTDPALRCRSITELAFAAGFNDLSHFSRSYKARYGCTPRDARHGTP